MCPPNFPKLPSKCHGMCHICPSNKSEIAQNGVLLRNDHIIFISRSNFPILTGNRSCVRIHMDMGGRDLSSMWTSVFGPDILYVFLCALSFWYEPHSNLRLLITGGISLLYLSGCGNTGNIGNSTYVPIQIWYLRYIIRS